MTCAQVQARLSEYLDKSLDPASTRTIEGHLSHCPQCRAEADLLAQCIRQIAALSDVEPPIGFAQRVIAHVKEMETKASFWEGLFLPFKVNLPIHATALVLIGIIGIYIFEREPQPKLIAPTQRTLTVPDKAEATSTPPELDQPPALSEVKTAGERPSGPVQKPVVEADQEPRISAVVPRGRATQAPQEQVPVTKPAATPKFPATPRADFPSGTEQRQSDTPPAGIMQSPQKPRVTAPIPVVSEPKGFSMPPGSAAPTPLDMLGGPIGLNSLASELHRLPAAPDVELIVRRRPQPSSQEDKESAGAPQKSTERGSAMREPTGKSIDQLLFNLRASTTPQTIWLTIPQNQYDRLKKELSVMGTIESEARTVSRDVASPPGTEGPLRVLLIVLSSDDPEPARAPGSNR